MLKWFIRRQIAKFEREFDYDMSYARAMLDADMAAFWKFNRVMGLANHRRDVPAGPWYAAKLAATLAEDCGPCTQLVVRMAERAGVPAAGLGALLARDWAAAPHDMAMGFRFAEAVIAHDPLAESLRQEIERCWGPRAVVSLGCAITAGRLFPTLKYALGHGIACQRVQVDGRDIVPAPRAA